MATKQELEDAYQILAEHYGLDPLAFGRRERPNHTTGLPDDICEQYGSMVMVNMRVFGAEETAIEVIREAFRVHRERTGEKVGVTTSLSNVLNTKLANKLAESNIRKVGDLEGKTEADLYGIKHISFAGVEEIKRMLIDNRASILASKVV